MSLSKITQLWFDHAFSQRNKATKRAAVDSQRNKTAKRVGGGDV